VDPETAANDEAPGGPGAQSNWCSGAKQVVGTSLGAARVWFTIGQGILNEVYYPRIDIPQIRDLGFIIADDNGFWCEVKRLDDCQLTLAEAGIPAVTSIHRHSRFTLTQRIVPDPHRDTMLIEVELTGDPELHPYVLLAPHLGGTGYQNIAEVTCYRGRRLLWAEQGPFGLALAAVNKQQRDTLGNASAGYSGTSDGWQDFNTNGVMRWQYSRAGPGNVALTAALPRRCVLALGLGSSREAAATLALSSLSQPFEYSWREQVAHWRSWHAACRLPVGFETLPPAIQSLVHTSAMVLRTHCDQIFRGAMVASLSVPWGEYAEERPGYHLVWPRDLVECAGGLLAFGADNEAREVLRYLIATQREDGSWYQNQWLGGKPYWHGIQLDEVAFPVLLAGILANRDALDHIAVTDMVERALGFIIRNGPVSPQDRWEENSGINAFTLTVCIAAMVCGARFLAPGQRTLVLELADYWNARLDDWTAVFDTDLDKTHGLSGHYLRITPPEALLDNSVLTRRAPIKNRLDDPGIPNDEQIGVDFLQLVRYGLRAADHPLITDTLKLVDKYLRVVLPQGPCWYRYNGDGYGEHHDGSPYDGTGQGRPWPLLLGERGHYELSRGSNAMKFLKAMAAMSNETGMLPEQVWDSNDIPEHGLRLGRPTGSAMPLAWAHAEFIKLACSILENSPIDQPAELLNRYSKPTPARVWFWTTQVPLTRIPTTTSLAICVSAPTTVSWQTDSGKTGHIDTQDTGLGVHVARIQPFDANVGEITVRYLDGKLSREYTVLLE